jgi:hypothetical protein
LAEQFCHLILTLNIANRQAVANLVMALASFRDAKSVVALSKSPVFHHQYSCVSKAIANLARNHHELKRVQRLFREHRLKYFPRRLVNYFQIDVVNIFRPFAPCLRDRQYRHKANNVIFGNKPLGIGYGLSSVNIADFESGWSLPLELRRVKSNEDEIEVGAAQIKAICESERFKEGLNINAADSHYGVAKYITKVALIPNLVNVLRLRHGNKVFAGEFQETGRAPQIYGAEYRLIEESGEKSYRRKEKTTSKYLRSIYEKEADESAEIEKETSKGKELRIELRRWRRMKMRSKRGHSMKAVEFDVVGIRVFEKETGKRVFKQDVFVAVVGEEQEKLSIEEVVQVFYHRFDLEVTNRLMKQNLFLEGYQTPELQHLDNWNELVQEAMWLLWAASTEVEKVSEKWQKYSEPKEEKGGRKTASQTRKGLERLFLTFEKEAFKPKKCKKGLGRKKGEVQERRKQYEVVKKWGAEVEILKPRLQKE